MLELIKGSVNLPTLTYDKIRLACWKQGITCDLRFSRKIFTSHLRHSGIEPEVVNLLQGRVISDILTRHYLVPQNSLKHQVIDALKQLQKMILIEYVCGYRNISELKLLLNLQKRPK